MAGTEEEGGALGLFPDSHGSEMNTCCQLDTVPQGLASADIPLCQLRLRSGGPLNGAAPASFVGGFNRPRWQFRLSRRRSRNYRLPN